MRRAASTVGAGGALLVIFAAVSPVLARERAPIPESAFDGGVTSAETLGRGNTIASNRGTPASGSENPASLEQPGDSGSMYSTLMVGTRSSLSREAANETDPVHGKVIQYLSVGADKGVLFYQPLSRLHQTDTVDASAGTTRDVDLNANAIGFAGSQKMKAGSLGLSLAYLWSAMDVVERSSGSITSTVHDTSDGIQMNIGFRYPTGPAMWGLVVQNAPGFLWGGHYRREQLPVRVRVGNTYRLAKGYLLSIDGERRFYREGGDSQDYIYVGAEAYVSQRFVIRFGSYGTSLNSADKRTVTAGATYIGHDNTQISYAYQQYQLDTDKIKRSIVSLQVPFVTGDK